jgi:hypothetical protein
VATSALGIPGDPDARKRGDALLKPTGTPTGEAIGIHEARTDLGEGTDADAAGLGTWATAQLRLMAGTMKALADASAAKTPWKFLVRQSSTAATVQATVGGTWAAGNTYTATIAGVSYTYTAVAGDANNNGSAASFATGFNASALGGAYKASASGPVVTFTAIAPGPNGASFSTAATPGAATFTASAALFTGGVGLSLLVMNRPHVLLKFIANNSSAPVTIALSDLDPGNSSDAQLVITVAANSVVSLGNVGVPFAQRLTCSGISTTAAIASVLLSGDTY